MGGMKAILGAVILVVIALILAPVVFSQAHDVQTDPRSQVFAGVTTGLQVTTADVVTTYTHFHINSVQHIGVTSDNVADTPVAATYVSATKTVHVTGLANAGTRTLTVTYETDALANYAGASAIMGLLPLIYIVGVIMLAAGIVWRTFV